MKWKEKEKDRNRGNKILLWGIIGGYLFFLTSGLWLPDFHEIVAPTPYYSTQRMENHTVYLTKWEYAPKEGVMEIILEVETLDILSENLEYEVLERTKGNMDVELVQQGADYMVFRITEIPENWKEMSLRLNEKGNQNLLKLYTNAEEVDEVTSLPKKDSAGYLADRLRAQIEYDTCRIEEKQQEISELEEENRKLESRIEELENAVYPTQEEADAALQRVESAESRIETNQKNMEKKTEEIQELSERSEAIQEEIEATGK